MAKATPIIAAMNAGEWSPLLEGRVDLQGYGASARTIENFIPTVQGPLVRRGGTRFVSEVKDSGDRTWLVPFIRSRAVAYQIEFGDLYCRFYFNRAQVVSGLSAYEIVSPYSAADLITDQGEMGLDFVQSRDVLYIAHRSGGHPLRKLSRTSSTSWAFSTVEPDDGPFLDANETATTIYSSAATGTVTLTASSSIFTADHVGALVRIDQDTITASDDWKTGTAYTSGDYVRSDGKEYVATNSATSGTSIPVHTSGIVSDGNVNWRYVSSGYGIARITAQSGTTATATVLTAFPQTVVGSGNASTNWRLGAWSALGAYPQAITFWRERLAVASDDRVDLSAVANFESFAVDEFGEITAESAVSLTLQSSESNAITGLTEASAGLIIHTEGGEHIMQSLTTTEPFGPGNVEIKPATPYGSRRIRPVRVGEAVLYVQSSGQKLREMIYDIQVDTQVSRDMTVRSEHLARPRIVGMVRQQEPYQLQWLWRSDGVVIPFTYDRTQEVRGWAKFVTDGAVESMSVIPSPDGTRDDVWLIVARTVGGETVRYVEIIAAEHQAGDDQAGVFYMDSGLTYDGSAATVISGLDHLEGETVRIVADGGSHPDRVVAGGSVTLQRASSVVQVGLPTVALYESFRLEAAAGDGTAQTKTKRITDVAFRVYETLGGQAGPDTAMLDDIPELMFRRPSTPMGDPPALYTGDTLMSWPSGYETDGRIVYRNDTGFPATLVAIVPQVVTQEAR